MNFSLFVFPYSDQPLYKISTSRKFFPYHFSDSDGNEVKQYLVKWKGYDSDENTWQNPDTLEDEQVQKKIRKFKKRRERMRNGCEVRYIQEKFEI